MSVWFLSELNREEAARAVAEAPFGSRVTIAKGKRSSPQNALMWALLSCFARQVQVNGQMYEPEDWKCVLMHAFGKEVRFLPALDGQGYVALGYRSSHLTKEEMSNFIEFIYAEGAKLEVEFWDRETGEVYERSA